MSDPASKSGIFCKFKLQRSDTGASVEGIKLVEKDVGISIGRWITSMGPDEDELNQVVPISAPTEYPASSLERQTKKYMESAFVSHAPTLGVILQAGEVKITDSKGMRIATWKDALS